jgi:hypothetical protein
VQFERPGAVSCELRSLRLHVALLFGAGHVFWLVLCSGGLVLLLLGAEPLQSGNKISVSGVCRIVSCIVLNENFTEVWFDHRPSACVAHEVWRSWVLPALPKSVIDDSWVAVLKRLRQVCIRC